MEGSGSPAAASPATCVATLILARVRRALREGVDRARRPLTVQPVVETFETREGAVDRAGGVRGAAALP